VYQKFDTNRQKVEQIIKATFVYFDSINQINKPTAISSNSNTMLLQFQNFL